MSDLIFICPNCKKKFTEIIQKVIGIQVLLHDFKKERFRFLELIRLDHLQFKCPGCNKRIPPSLEDEILEKMRKETRIKMVKTGIRMVKTGSGIDA